MPVPETSEPTYEEALQRLETLLVAIEDGDVPLAELVEKYEQASRLLEVCERRLRDAELRLEILRGSASRPVLEPLAAPTA
jgi:exodeoxyribonuclease VII small subunit